MSINTMFSHFISYSGAIWQILRNNNQHCSKHLNMVIGLLRKWTCRATSPKHKRHWFWVRNSTCAPLHCTTFSRWCCHSPILQSGNAWDSYCHTVTIAFLVLAQTWNLCTGKPSSRALSKQHSPPDSDLFCLGLLVGKLLLVSIWHYPLQW